jgi:hypothetical protein
MKKRKEIVINLDKPRRLILDEKALEAFKAAGGNFGEVIASKQPSLWDMVTLGHCALIHEDPGLTIEKLMKLLHITTMQPFFVAVADCVGDVYSWIKYFEVKHG